MFRFFVFYGGCVTLSLGFDIYQVYNVRTTDGEELGVVARVASPDFPKDKLKSEVSSSCSFVRTDYLL